MQASSLLGESAWRSLARHTWKTNVGHRAFNHVNYEDPDINVAIPVFSIHGNHDDPSGEGHLAPLDILQMSGLINYYGRTPESDNIQVKPVLLQKGTTKLALYGMSNVRDERLFRTFRDGNVRFFQPNTCLLYTSPSPRDGLLSRMPSSA